MKRTKSGIPGFDEITGGGFPTGTCCLVSGNVGAGKTTFGMQFLYNGIVQYNENGIYVALEERPEDLRAEMLVFGWNLSEFERKNKLVILDVTATRHGIRRNSEMVVNTVGRSIDIRGLAAEIYGTANEINAKRIVVDSIPALELRMKDVMEVRKATSQLVNLLLEMNRTSIVITELTSTDGFSRYGFEEYVTRGVVVLRMVSQYGE
ncbi:MAG: ATPase domain-containing protein, partial [Candidatus Methanofastidiosia archaeon]